MSMFPDRFEKCRLQEMMRMVQDLLNTLTSSNNNFIEIFAILNELKQWAANHAEIRMYLFDAMRKLIANQSVDNLYELPSNEGGDCAQTSHSMQTARPTMISAVPGVRVRNDSFLFNPRTTATRRIEKKSKSMDLAKRGTTIPDILLPCKVENASNDDNVELSEDGSILLGLHGEGSADRGRHPIRSNSNDSEINSTRGSIQSNSHLDRQQSTATRPSLKRNADVNTDLSARKKQITKHSPYSRSGNANRNRQ